MRASHTPGIVKHRGMQEVLGLQNTGPECARVSIKAPGLVHKNRKISVMDGCQT